MPPRFLKPALRGYHPYVPGLQPPDSEGWVKLNTNESPWPPSTRVIGALRDAIDDSIRLYPDPTSGAAREAIGRMVGLPASWVAMGNGGDELIAMSIRAFAGAGQRVAFPAPSYPLYETVSVMYECEAAPHQLDEGWHLPRSLAEDPAPLKFVANPNSPTGTWYPRHDIEALLRETRGVVVLDEAYVDFAPEARHDLLQTHDNLLILRTFSKSAALAGLRIGYALAQPGLIEALDIVKDSYNLDRLAIVAAVAAAEDEDHRRALIDRVVRERQWLTKRLDGLSFTVEPSAANFLFVRPPSGRPAAMVYERLKARKILVRHYERPPIEGWLRVTVGTHEQHERLLEALEEVLS